MAEDNLKLKDIKKWAEDFETKMQAEIFVYHDFGMYFNSLREILKRVDHDK